MEHTNLLPECKVLFKSIDDKLLNLVTQAEKINGRYEKHMEAGSKWRLGVVGVYFMVLAQLVGVAFVYGKLAHTAETNEKRINLIIDAALSNKLTENK